MIQSYLNTALKDRITDEEKETKLKTDKNK